MHNCEHFHVSMLLKEREDHLQRGIVLCFYDLQDYVLINWFFSVLKLVSRNMSFQHKVANLSHVRQISLWCKITGLQPQATPQEKVYVPAGLKLSHSLLLGLFYVAEDT